MVRSVRQFHHETILRYGFDRATFVSFAVYRTLRVYVQVPLYHVCASLHDCYAYHKAVPSVGLVVSVDGNNLCAT